MDKEIIRLRKKFFRLSAVISLTVIASMLIVLNLLMTASYNKELKSAEDILVHTAISNAPDLNRETFYINELEMTSDNNYIVRRNAADIVSVTLYGDMTCENPDASWYNAGGGLLFLLEDSPEGQEQFVYKEYKFNRENNSTEIDFTGNDDFKLDNKQANVTQDMISDDFFLISNVWWTSSSDDYFGKQEVTLNLESVEIVYRDNFSVASYDDYKPLLRTFGDIFPDGEPDTLSDNDCFYIIRDKEENIVEINSGNISTAVDIKTAKSIKIDSQSNIMLDEREYSCRTAETDDICIYTFIHNNAAEKSTVRLLTLSAVSGGVIYILLLILIHFISGAAVKPISESYHKQKEFISNAGHELKTPITVISATAELMEKKNGADVLTDCINAQTEKMSRLVNEMLSLTRLTEPERLYDGFEVFNISTVAENASLYFESRAFEESKTITADIAKNLKLKGNADKIDELIGILLDNALKYSDEGADIKLALKSENGRIKLSCSNKCSDFKPASLPRLFDRFYRGDESHSDEKEGFGLGLSIAKEITELHKGKIYAEYVGQTITFTAEFNES